MAAWKKIEQEWLWLKGLLWCYRNRTGSKQFNLSLKEYFYEVFSKKKLYEDGERQMQKFQILLCKDFNCRPRFTIHYDVACCMLILHKLRKNNNPLIDILLDKQCTINCLEDMIIHKWVQHHALARHLQAVKYSPHHGIKSLAKDKP